MNRRRFLKYAVATAAVVGASALGIDYLGKLPLTINQVTTNQSQIATSSTTHSGMNAITTSVRLASMHGRLFFDYNGNGIQDGDEPGVPKANVQLKQAGKFVAEAITDSAGDFKLDDVPTGSWISLQIEADEKFRYKCRSSQEFTTVDEGYQLVIGDSVTVDVGLMEGFLTAPMLSTTHYEIDRFYDRDPKQETYIWWNGRRGGEASAKRGFAPNHPGIDYYMREGEPLLAQAPGVVEEIGEDERGRYIWIQHRYGFRTSSGHVSEVLVRKGEKVTRGQPIAKSGSTFNQYPHDHQQLTIGNYPRIVLDPYAPEFEMKIQYSGYYDMSTYPFPWVSAPINASNPNLENYWTRRNKPQYSDQH